PTRAAGKGVAHGDELRAPSIHGTEIRGERFGESRRRLVAELAARDAREVELVQERRIERDELFALETVHHVARRSGEGERRQLLGNGVQAAQRAAVVVLVMRLDELEGNTVQLPGTAVNGCELVTHACLRRGWNPQALDGAPSWRE